MDAFNNLLIGWKLSVLKAVAINAGLFIFVITAVPLKEISFCLKRIVM